MSAANDVLGRLVAELAEEQSHFLTLVDDLRGDQWSCVTPAVGWTIHDQLAHLALVEELAAAAVVDPTGFTAQAGQAAADPTGFEAGLEALGRSIPAADLLARWRVAQESLLAGVANREPRQRVSWFGPSMSPASFLVARLMETWAHGQDVRDALGVSTPRAPRLRSIADLGLRTRGWSYQVRGREPDDTPFRVQLVDTDGERIWGDGPLGVVGTVLDFCLVVTQRRHWADTGLTPHHPAAEAWLEIAQAFAGPATTVPPGRAVRETTTGKEVR